ncbi:hypothetical protein ACFOD9_03780 [Novosphingobium bradum]|uniref:Uncharacterized protein n=1 Tax=Novosphingobium bradum TaxID=1737444 RepID=A0ABV7IR73_9SPHN
MTGERTETALARIDAALARINQASTRVGTRTGDIARQHDRLRSAVAQTLHDLDLLISEQEGAGA